MVWTATLLARDGAVTAELSRQLERIPADVSHIVISVGGNDALRSTDLLPFQRAIDAGLSAIDLKTLAEAARGLGASWGAVLLRVVVPNIRTALIAASLLSVALVLGEFTVASLLNFDTLQVRVNLLGKRDAGVSIAVSLLSLLFAFALLFLLSFIGRRRRAAVGEG